MKRIIPAALVVVILLGSVGVAHARGRGGGHGGHFHGGHGRVIVGFGPSFYFGPYWSPYGYGYYPPPYAVAPPVVLQEPPVDFQQSPVSRGTWYYCMSAHAYYPTVPTCAEAWVPVPARN